MADGIWFLGKFPNLPPPPPPSPYNSIPVTLESLFVSLSCCFNIKNTKLDFKG